MKFTGNIENLAKVFKQADSFDYEAGLSAYFKYNRLMRLLAEKYKTTIPRVTSVFVATSPNNDYKNNLKSTVSILEGHKNGTPDNKIKISTYNHCRTRALNFLRGEDFLSVTKGLKTRAFFQNIIDPTDWFPVTVDGHMVGAWAGKKLLMKEVAKNRFEYEKIAEDVRKLASQVNLLPCQVQGICWFTWKRINNVVYDDNLNLFGDHWGLDIDPRTIQPFN